MAFWKIFYSMLKAIFLMINLMTSLCRAKIPDDPIPINIYNKSDQYFVFRGTSMVGSSMVSDTQLHSLEGLQRIARNFYIYAREHIFVIDAECSYCNNQWIPYKQVETWTSNEEDTSLCIQKGQEENKCKNFLKIFQQEASSNNVTVCGTNSFMPECRMYQISSDGKLQLKEGSSPGKLMCPYEPDESIANMISNGSLYTATTGGFNGQDPLIVRSPRTSPLMLLRTTRSDDAMLNDPKFLRFVDWGKSQNKVFVFLTEWAIEDDFQAVYSRVGQVCKNDQGGSSLLRREFTSFFKARLNCSLPGQPPFYFNEMQDVSDGTIMHSWYGVGNKKMVFAVMNTPRNSVPASAVCVFTLDDIDRSMNGPFLQKNGIDGSERVYWEKLEDYPQPHLSRCDRSPRELSHENLNFVRKHPLMHDSVPAWNMRDDVTLRSGPLFTRTRSRNFFTTIAVDTNAGLQSKYTVLFIGTEDGKIVKIVLLQNGQNIVVEERMVFNSNCGNTSRVVKKILLDEPSGTMMVAFESCVVRAPLCPLAESDCEKECIRSRDPYCAWNTEACVIVDEEYANKTATSAKKQLVQDVENGYTDKMPDCPVHGLSGVPKGEISGTTAVFDNVTEAIAPHTEPQSNLTEEMQPSTASISTTLLIVIASAAAVIGLLCGMLLFWVLQRKRLSSLKLKYSANNGKIVTSNIYESEKLVNDRQHSNQSTQSKQRNASTSSQRNSNPPNDEHKRKRTETENSRGNRSDEEGVFLQPNDAVDSIQPPDNDVLDASRRNQLLSTGSSVNGKKQIRDSKQSSASSNETVEKLHSVSPQKHPVPFFPPDQHYQPVYAVDEFSRQPPTVSSANGVMPDPNQVNSSRKVMRVAPSRSMSFQDRPMHPAMPQSRAYSMGNKGANTVGHSNPARGINRQLSLQMPDMRSAMIGGNPQGFYSPQTKAMNWRPQLPGDPNLTPIKNGDNRKLPDMTHSLDRRRHKAHNHQMQLAEPLEGNQQMPPPNGPSRKRYVSESDKIQRHLMSRAPQCQAIREEQDPSMAYPEAKPDVQTRRQNLSLNLQSQHSIPENGSNHTKDPAFGRIVSTSHSHSNPGTPIRELPPNVLEYATPVHVFPHSNLSEQLRQDSMESKPSPTKSNPPTPMYDGRFSNFPEGDRRRNFSGPNYSVNQPSSPINAPTQHFPHPNMPNSQYPQRIRNHSGGSVTRPKNMHPVNGIQIDNYPAPATPKTEFPITQSSHVPIT